MLKNILTSLNGWQRIFVFVLIFLYLPLTILAINEVEKTYVHQFSNEQLNKEISDYLIKEKLSMTVFIEADYDELAKKFGGTSVGKNSDKQTIEKPNASDTSQVIKVKISSDKDFFYIATFNYLKDPKLFDDDIEVIKIADFIQNLVNKNEFIDTSKYKIIKIFFIFMVVSALTYFIGFMIGWVKKGFK